MEEHGREGFAEFVPRDKRPEYPVDERGRDHADDEGEAARPGEGRGEGVSLVGVCTEGYDSEAEAADDAGAGMGALGKSMQHWDHVERSEDSEDIGIAVTGSIRQASPEGSQNGIEATDPEILKCAAHTRVLFRSQHSFFQLRRWAEMHPLGADPIEIDSKLLRNPQKGVKDAPKFTYHHDPDRDDGPPTLICIPPAPALLEPSRYRDQCGSEGDFEGES